MQSKVILFRMDQYLKLPSLISNKDSESSITPSTSIPRDADDEAMRIAWRYANTPQVESTVGKQKQSKYRILVFLIHLFCLNYGNF